MTNEEYEEIKKRVIEELKAEQRKRQEEKRNLYWPDFPEEKARIKRLIEQRKYKNTKHDSITYDVYNPLRDVCRVWAGAYRVRQHPGNGTDSVYKNSRLTEQEDAKIERLLNRLIDVLGEEEWRTEAQ